MMVTLISLQVENILNSYNETSGNDRLLEEAASLTTEMCKPLKIGDSAVATPKFGVLRCYWSNMENIDTNVLNVSCDNCTSGASAKLDENLKRNYTSWKCDNTKSSNCSGACVVSMQLKNELLSEDSNRSSDVVYVALYNPRIYEVISVLGMSPVVTVTIPLTKNPTKDHVVEVNKS